MITNLCVAAETQTTGADADGLLLIAVVWAVNHVGSLLLHPLTNCRARTTGRPTRTAASTPTLSGCATRAAAGAGSAASARACSASTPTDVPTRAGNSTAAGGGGHWS
jgi:hypothetical protein